MARPTNNPALKIAEYEAKIARLRMQSTENEYKANSVVQTLISERDILKTATAEASKGLYSSVPAFNLSIRAHSTAAKLAMIQNEAILSEVTLRYSQAFDSFIERLISDTIKSLAEGEDESDVTVQTEKEMTDWRERNSELVSEYEKAKVAYADSESAYRSIVEGKKTAERANKGRQSEDTIANRPSAIEIVNSILGK